MTKNTARLWQATASAAGGFSGGEVTRLVARRLARRLAKPKCEIVKFKFDFSSFVKLLNKVAEFKAV